MGFHLGYGHYSSICTVIYSIILISLLRVSQGQGYIWVLLFLSTNTEQVICIFKKQTRLEGTTNHHLDTPTPSVKTPYAGSYIHVISDYVMEARTAVG